jgi:competence protein ComFC
MSRRRVERSIFGASWCAVAAFVVDAVYPKRCAGCARRGVWLCAACDGTLTLFDPPWCERCGVPWSLSACKCSDLPEYLERVRSVGPFDGWLRDAIHLLKYHGEWGRVDQLGPLAAAAAEDLGPYDVIVPVPLHPSRAKQRGFNQAELLAKVVGTMSGVTTETLLIRRRATAAQAQLGADDRAVNVRGAFALAEGANIGERSMLLVDDVITTGATLGACAAALHEAGAGRIVAVSIAREL